MIKTSKILCAALVALQLVPSGAGAFTYQLDNGSISTILNASEGTESLDNWFGNVFTVTGGPNQITAVDFGVYTTTPGSVGSVSLYLVTGAGGNPALGASRLFTQAFTPLAGDGTNAFLQQITLTTPVSFNLGDKFLVGVMIRNVTGAPPNDVYPFLLDTSGSAAGTFWDRSAPNTFDVDNLTGAVPINQALTPGGFVPGAGHVFIRAEATVVPEPAALALSGIGLAAGMMIKRRSR